MHAARGAECRDNKIGNEGLTALARALADGAAPELKELELKDNKIGNEGLTALARALADGAAPELKELKSRNKKIGNEGLKALARALADGAAPKLKELNLGMNDFSGADEGLRLLGQAKLPALKKLDLSNSSFNLAALAEGMQEGSWPSLEQLWMMQQRAGERRGGGGARPRARARRHAQAEGDLCQWRHVGGGQGRRRQGAAGRRGEDV